MRRVVQELPLSILRAPVTTPFSQDSMTSNNSKVIPINCTTIISGRTDSLRKLCPFTIRTARDYQISVFLQVSASIVLMP